MSGAQYLKNRRLRFANEMQSSPETRTEVAGMLWTEGANDPVPVMESLFNRCDYTNKTIHQMLFSGFYGPINRGQLPRAITFLRNNPNLMERMQNAIDTALNGSNFIKGATDQGLPTDPNGKWQGGRIERGGNIFNDWGGGPGGHAGAAKYRTELMQGYAAADAGAHQADQSSPIKPTPKGYAAADAGAHQADQSSPIKPTPILAEHGAPMTKTDDVFSEIETGIATAESILPMLMPLLSLIPGFGKIAPFLQLIPTVMNAAKAVQAVIPGASDHTAAQIVAAHLTPGLPNAPSLGPDLSTQGGA